MSPKYLRNAGKHWSPPEKRQLAEFAAGNMPTRVIGLKLGRPEGAIYNMASKLAISLDPTNQSPYNRHK